jgi:hypothetical protein
MADADPTDFDACSDTVPQLEDFNGIHCVAGVMSFDESSSDYSDDDDNDPTYIFDGSDSSYDNDDLTLSLEFDEATCRDVAKGKRAPHTVSSRDHTSIIYLLFV